MSDFNLTDRDFKDHSFQSLVSTGTVVVSHAVDVMAELPYYRYLEDLGTKVIMVDSKASPVLHMMAETHGLQMGTYTDPQQNLVKTIKQKLQLDTELRSLTRLMRFQILYVDGNEVDTWHQPVSHQWKNFIEDKVAVKRFINKFGSFGVKWMQEQDKEANVIWTGYNQAAYARPINCPYDFDIFLKYYKLMPNEELEEKINSVQVD